LKLCTSWFKVGFKHRSSVSSHLSSQCNIRGKLKDQIDQCSDVSGFNNAAAPVLLDYPGDLAVVGADGDHRPASGGNSIDFAGNDQAFDFWLQRNPMDVGCAKRALHLRGYSSVREPEPFTAVIFCTADRDKVDDRTRSKWSRVLRYAAAFKDLDEPLRDFIKRKAGINRCAARYARRLRRGRTIGAGGWAARPMSRAALRQQVC
jgi:hypothetical protein